VPLCLADAARIIVARSQLFADELVGVGGIASIGLRSADIERYLVAYGGKLEVAGLIGPRSVTGGYWYANARRPVLFEPTMRRLLADGCRLFVESSTHPVLTVAMAATADQAGCPATITATLRRGHGGPDQFLAARARIAAGPTPARTAA
jgi:acyl transferase domain-containing protein